MSKVKQALNDVLIDALFWSAFWLRKLIVVGFFRKSDEEDN